MTEYFELLQRKKDFLEFFQRSLRDAEENSLHENNSTLLIQRVYRGVVDRKKIAKKSFKANEIQRVFRGLVGRNIARANLRRKLEGRQLSLYHYLCIQIQRIFRGFYSRKYKHDQTRRKLYCKMLVEKGQMIRQSMQQYSEDLLVREQEEREKKKEDDSIRLAQNLHHLVSTRSIPGIYKPNNYYNETPTLNDTPIEEHVRGVVKDLLRTRGIAHTGLVVDLNGTKKVPLKGLKNRLSIQASAPYDTMEKEAMRQRHLHKILTADKESSFTAGGKTNLINKNMVPLCTGDPFMDAWANPLLVKGVPKDQKQLMECTSTRKPLFVSHQEQPFYPRAGGNRSTVLPNDVFDVIADAEETGGAIQRQRGTNTTRFGLSANCDNRVSYTLNSDDIGASGITTATKGEDSTIPRPPLRASCTVKSTRSKVQKVTLKLKMSKTTGSSDINGTHSLLANAGLSLLKQQPLHSYDSSSDED